MQKKQARSINPCGYNVLIDMLPVEKKTSGGIVIPENLRNREQAAMSVGKVLAFGPVAFRMGKEGVNSPEDWGVKVGDYVKFPTHAYMKCPTEDCENAIMVLDHDVKAVVELNEEAAK